MRSPSALGIRFAVKADSIWYIVISISIFYILLDMLKFTYFLHILHKTLFAIFIVFEAVTSDTYGILLGPMVSSSRRSVASCYRYRTIAIAPVSNGYFPILLITKNPTEQQSLT